MRLENAIRLAATAILLAPLTCTATRHSADPYASDPAQARVVEQQAEQRCAQSLEAGRQLPRREFTTDGCTLWFDARWGECCVQHDQAYWCGGTAGEREQADRELRECVADVAGNWVAALTHFASRVGGHPVFPTPYRWSYGRDYRPFYDEFPASAE